MNDIRDRLCSKMSSGMRQKVSIARALIHDPPVLIFDEATAGLDVLVGRSFLEIITRLREQGKCIIFSTHIMREVEKLCDRAVGGYLAESELRKQVVHQVASPLASLDARCCSRQASASKGPNNFMKRLLPLALVFDRRRVNDAAFFDWARVTGGFDP